MSNKSPPFMLPNPLTETLYSPLGEINLSISTVVLPPGVIVLLYVLVVVTPLIVAVKLKELIVSADGLITSTVGLNGSIQRPEGVCVLLDIDKSSAPVGSYSTLFPEPDSMLALLLPETNATTSRL